MRYFGEMRTVSVTFIIVTFFIIVHCGGNTVDMRVQQCMWGKVGSRPGPWPGPARRFLGGRVRAERVCGRELYRYLPGQRVAGYT